MTALPTTANRLAPLRVLQPGELLVHEIYRSVQGESTFAGLPCVFVRTTGCSLRCRWCDTPHAFTQGERLPRA
jgi:7-carboxy-7-deazaguanine synthase